MADGLFPHLAQDLALLHGLGVRLVLVHGIRPQVEQRLQENGARLVYHQGLRVTDPAALACVKEAAGTVRVEVEALLSMGVANSPMAGARIRVASGNFVIAKPVGVRDGIDFGQTGEVRRIDAESIRRQLDGGNVVLLSPIGYSPTGDVFNLSAEEVATATAIALNADKLLLFMEQPCRSADGTSVLHQLTAGEAESLLAQDTRLDAALAAHVKAALTACGNGVARVHLLDRHIDGAILLELFTRDGVGTLLSATPFEDLRPARLDDIGGILDLIAPLESSGILIPRPRERLEMDIDDYVVIERDGMIIGCAALHPYPDERMGELACLALHPDYRGEKRGERLLEHVENSARRAGLERLFALTTRTSQWFRERGFEPLDLKELPAQKQEAYSPRRNSRVLTKSLGAAAANKTATPTVSRQSG